MCSYNQIKNCMQIESNKQCEYNLLKLTILIAENNQEIKILLN